VAKTYEAIATNTVSGSTTSSVTFSSIPATWTDLLLVGDLKGKNQTLLPSIRLNGDTGTNYSTTKLHGNGASAASNSSGANAPYMLEPSVAVVISTAAPALFYACIMSYANTSVNKTGLAMHSAPETGVERSVGMWRSTNAVTSLTIHMISGTLAANSTFSLYGIKAA
jgi:hypothetical protein